VLSLDRDTLAPDTLGLQRGEVMDLLSAVQGVLVDEQAKAALATQVACPECGRPRRVPSRVGRACLAAVVGPVPE
jgi:hypothetical protein